MQLLLVPQSYCHCSDPNTAAPYLVAAGSDQDVIARHDPDAAGPDLDAVARHDLDAAHPDLDVVALPDLDATGPNLDAAGLDLDTATPPAPTWMPWGFTD